MVTEPTIYVDWPLRLLQGIRLAQAVVEARCKIVGPPNHRRLLRKATGAIDQKVRWGSSVDALYGVGKINHATPTSRIGAIQRILIFPHAILSHCNDRWSPTRGLAASFCGLVTQERQLCIEQWLTMQGTKSKSPQLLESVRPSRVRRWRRRRVKKTKNIFALAGGRVEIIASNGGRIQAHKVWDPEYYSILLNSRFAICPAGDFKWTYRFFEAAMCGAIPIVETPCQAYDGFQFLTFNDPLPSEWPADLALSNVVKCREALTVPQEELVAELNKLSTSSHASAI